MKNTHDDAVTKVHVFEAAGLGKAPFRYIGYEEKRGPIITRHADGTETHTGSPGQPMGVCRYCGEALANCFWVESADGKRFMVGSTCVGKTGDAGLKKQADRVIRNKRKAARDAREIERIAAAGERLNADAELCAKLTAEPHPYGCWAEQGKTRLDWAEWMFENAVRSGKMEVVRYIDKIGK